MTIYDVDKDMKLIETDLSDSKYPRYLAGLMFQVGLTVL